MANPYAPDYESDDFGDAIEAFNSEVDSASIEESGLARSLVNEMVKSYGFKVGGDGTVEWSLGNIKQAWDENKLSFLVDYATLLMPVAKFGTTAVKISNQLGKAAKAAGGVSTVARAAAAGEFAGQRAASRLGKIASRLGVSDDVVAATEFSLARNVAGEGRFAKWTYTGLGAKPGTQARFSELYAKYGGGAGDALTEARTLQMERTLGKEVTKQRAVGMLNTVRKLNVPADDPRFLQALESGDATRSAAALFPDDPEAVAAVASTHNYRTGLQLRAHKLGQISFEQLDETFGTYMPTIREPYKEIGDLRREAGFRGSRMEVKSARAGANDLIEEATTDVRNVTGEASTEGYKPGPGRQMRGGAARFTAKSKEEVTVARSLDPQTNIAALAQLDDKLSHLEYIDKVAKSSLAYDAERIGQDMLRIVRDQDVAAAAAYGIDKAKLPTVRRLVESYEELGYKAAGEKIAEHLGWRKLDHKLLAGTETFLLENLPGKPLEKWVHPAMAAELADSTALFAKSGAGKLYSELMTIFRTKSTAWNPSSYMRNTLGAWMYHAAGGGGLAPDRKALTAVLGRGERELFEAGLARGVVGSGTGTEAFQTALHGLPLTAESALEGISWLGEGRLVKAAQRASGKAEQVYRGIDDVFKLSLFAKKTRQFQRSLKVDIEKARDLAAAHVAKFSPTFYGPSNFTKVVSQVVPFSGFTSEAIRTYRNLAMERPLHALAMGHMVSGLTQVSAAMAGMSTAELESAKQTALPDNMKNGQALLLPFRGAGGTPEFLDLSYVIPLATIGQTPLLEQMAAPWANDLYNVTANPVIGAAAAATTGVDPFTKSKIQPRFAEEQLGMSIVDPSARKAVGLMEYAMRTAAPTWAPPGWAATNILEAARGTVDPTTGAPKEQSLPRALAGNLFGLKVVSADADNVLKDSYARAGAQTERQTNLWKGWKRALANGDVGDMEDARRSLMAEWVAQGASVQEARQKFVKGQAAHSRFANLSTKRLKEMLARLENVPGAEASAARAELFRRHQERRLKAAGSGRRTE